MRGLGLGVAALSLLADQAGKAWALAALWPPQNGGIVLLPVLNLRLGFNTGVAFGIFASSGAWLLVLLSLGVVALLLAWLWRSGRVAEVVGLGLIIGGALGNVADRVRIGAVVDFIDAHYAGWHWPTFNLADVAILAGVGLLVLAGLRSPVETRV